MYFLEVFEIVSSIAPIIIDTDGDNDPGRGN